MIEERAKVGPYVLERKIAEGGFGEVWMVRHADLPKPFAAKLILDPDCAASLRREGELLCDLDHPNVVRVVNADLRCERPYLVMEYMEGGSLRERIARGAIPVSEALRIARAILQALAFAHSKKIVHRDLKPENILFDSHDWVKVCDLGSGGYWRGARIHSSSRMSCRPKGGSRARPSTCRPS